MCDTAYISTRTRTSPRPPWGRLYGSALFAVGAVAAVDFVAVPDTARIVLRSVLAIAGLVAMAFWVRSNRVALDQQDWCACAAETITVRIVPSTTPRSLRPADDDTLIEELAGVSR